MKKEIKELTECSTLETKKEKRNKYKYTGSEEYICQVVKKNQSY